jgi:hypothetical protein
LVNFGRGTQKVVRIGIKGVGSEVKEGDGIVLLLRDLYSAEQEEASAEKGIVWLVGFE